MKTIFLDAGHGGIDPKSGKYTTAPGKMWKHPKGKFHNGTFFYEGVSNRQFCDEIIKVCNRENINVVKVYHDWKDNSLDSRTNIANNYHNTISQGIYLSMHSNAINWQDKAEGFSVWTSPGKSVSDDIATAIWATVGKVVAPKWGIKMRADRSDGDPDYEARFSVLIESGMPSVLIENLFFDNYNDSLKLMNPEYQADIAESTVDSLLPFLKEK
jgi:N-acetylmuramoyl-L-alanine amidase